MSKRDSYKILSEVYEQLFTEERAVRQIPFTTDELKVLTALYDFEVVNEDKTELKRIPAAGTVERLVKYSDNSFVRMVDEGRGITKYEYWTLYDLIQSLAEIYKVDKEVAMKQTPNGPDNPYGMEPGGTNQINQRYDM